MEQIDHMTDEALRASAARGTELGLPGSARRAAVLLEVPFEHRVECSLLGNYICNTTPGYRPSDALFRAAQILRENNWVRPESYR